MSRWWVLASVVVISFTASSQVYGLNCTDEQYPYSDCSCQNITDIGLCNSTTGTCACNSTCFSLNVTTNCCELDRCYRYLDDTGDCQLLSRNRVTAILLSVFLINFGAANFYIGRYELAVPQIILGLFLCFFQVGSCAVSKTRDEDTSIPCIICCSFNSLLSLLFLAWWIADLAIFISNTRLDGKMCPLIWEFHVLFESCWCNLQCITVYIMLV